MSENKETLADILSYVAPTSHPPCDSAVLKSACERAAKFAKASFKRTDFEDRNVFLSELISCGILKRNEFIRNG